MTKFPASYNFMPDMERVEKMNREFVAKLPKEFAGAANLMVHPAAGLAAASAIGVGIASQSFGLWMGLFSASAQRSQRMFAPFFGNFADPDDSFEEEPEAPAERAARATKAIIGEAQSIARDLTETASAVVEKTADVFKPVPEVPAVKLAPKPAEKVARVARKAVVAPSAEIAEPVVEAKPVAVVAKVEATTVERTVDASPAHKAVEPLAESKPVVVAKVKVPETEKPVTAPAARKAAEPVSAKTLVKPAWSDKPVVADDLKAISGVGPKLEKVLNDLGVWTYAQVAAWSEGEINWVDDHLGFNGRIGRDDWIGQAKTLASGTRH